MWTRLSNLSLVSGSGLTSGPKSHRWGNRNETQSTALARRARLCHWSPDLHRNHGPADFGLKSGGHFRRLAWAGNRLAALLKCPDMLAGAFRDVSHCVLFDRTICREVPKVGNSGDEAVALAIEDCPVPDPAHASRPFVEQKAAMAASQVTALPGDGSILSRNRRQNQNLTHWCVLEALPGLRSPIWPNDDRRMDTAKPNGHI